MDSFLHACGTRTGARVAIQGGDHIVYALPQACVLIGRSPLCDIRLDHPEVSPRHAYLQMIEGRLACFDLGTRDGLRRGYTNGVRSTWIEHDVNIGIGPFGLRRADNTHVLPLDHLTDPQQISHTWGSIFLESLDESITPHLWHITHAITLIGRASQCHVRLPTVSVSWFHCSLVCTPQGVWVVDLMSRGGVVVNGIPTKCMPLYDGDELVLGEVRCLIRHTNRTSIACESAARTTNITRLHDTEAHAQYHPPSLPSDSLPKEVSRVPEVINPMEADMPHLRGVYDTDAYYPPLMMLVERFGHMQQRMLEHFHDTMVMMMNVSKANHTEIHHVREEVERLRELSQELLALKGHLSRQPSSHDPRHARIYDSATTGHTVQSVLEGPTPSQAPLAETVKHDTPETQRMRLPIGSSHEDPLVQVTRRIAQIRNEQRTHWQKILDVIRLR